MQIFLRYRLINPYKATHADLQMPNVLITVIVFMATWIVALRFSHKTTESIPTISIYNTYFLGLHNSP